MTRRQISFEDRYEDAIGRGVAHRAREWAAPFDAPSTGRFTWYVNLRVRQDVNGDVSDLTVRDIDPRQRSRVVTVALLGVIQSGPRTGELRRLTKGELTRNFDHLVDAAVRRHGLVPVKGTNAVQRVFRHKSG